MGLWKSRPRVGWIVAGLALSASLAAAAPADFDPDATAALTSAQETAKDAGGLPAAGLRSRAVWVTVGRGDTVRPSWSVSPLGVPVTSSQRAALFRVPEDRLIELSRFMHDKFGRCGGFFAHASRQQAEADLAGAPASRGGPYTIDQESLVRPLMDQVKEAELRSTIEALAALNNRYYRADTGVQAAHWVESRWQTLAAALPGASVSLVAHDWQQPSVVLTIPGSQKSDEVVVLGGHLDSINGWGSAAARAPGADDNASGVAVLTEAVRLLAQAKFRPQRTIQFMAYAAEEVGLRGSQDIAAKYAAQGTHVAGVIQFDMTNFKGSGDEVYLLDDNVDADLTKFLGQLIDRYLSVSWSTTSCGYACSDHASWSQNGYPASAAFESSFDGMNRNIHSEKDTLENSGGNAQHSMSFARLATAFAVELAKSAGGSSLLAHGR